MVQSLFKKAAQAIQREHCENLSATLSCDNIPDLTDTGRKFDACLVIKTQGSFAFEKHDISIGRHCKFRLVDFYNTLIIFSSVYKNNRYILYLTYVTMENNQLFAGLL